MIECVPVARADVVKVALWVLTVIVEVPRTVVPSLKVNVPVGEPPNPGVTVAVNVTDCPLTDGFREETTELLVAALFTVWVKAAEVLASKSVFPEYAAVIEFAPKLSDAVAKAATPLAFNETLPKTVAPSLNVTVPLGIPLVADVSLAVKVTDWLNAEGFTEVLSAVKLKAFSTLWVSVADVLALKSVFPE